MEHFLEGIALLGHWYINPNEKSNKCKSSLLIKLTKASYNGAVPSRKCSIKVPAKCITSVYMSWWRFAFNEVNNWGPKFLSQNCFIGADWMNWRGLSKFFRFRLDCRSHWFQCCPKRAKLFCVKKRAKLEFRIFANFIK